MCTFVAVFTRVLARTLVVHGERFMIASRFAHFLVMLTLPPLHTPPFFTHENGTTTMYTTVVGGSMDGRAAGGGVGGLRGLTLQCGRG